MWCEPNQKWYIFNSDAYIRYCGTVECTTLTTREIMYCGIYCTKDQCIGDTDKECCWKYEYHVGYHKCVDRTLWRKKR